MIPDRVFVYGTLRRGGSNHGLIAEAPLLGEFRTAPAYRMLDLGYYPGVIAGGETVVGEVYRVTPIIMQRLDRLEDVPHLYVRDRLETPWGHAWIYIYRQSVRGAPRVPEGDWMRYGRSEG